MTKTRWQRLQRRNRPDIMRVLNGTDEDGAMFYAVWREQEHEDAMQWDMALRDKWEMAEIAQKGV